MKSTAEPQWQPLPPFAPPPRDTGGLPPGAVALLDRLDAWAERMIARYPALAEAVRRDAARRGDAAAD